MIQYEQEIIEYLGLPSIPKRAWDGQKSFKHGIAVTEMLGGGHSYAVATYHAERDGRPRIVKVFSAEPFRTFEIVAVVPDYMDTTDIERWDVDDESKRAASRIAAEAAELENEDACSFVELPENEYLYDHIHNDDEARAFIRSWNKLNGYKRGVAPSTHDGIITKLMAMWMQDRNK